MKLAHVLAGAVLLAGCSGGVSAPPLAEQNAAAGSASGFARHATGLGKVLSSKKGGQIFGFDIDRNGNDGTLATATSVETFDQDSGAILKTFPKSPPSGTTYGFNAIVTGDVGLVTRYVQPKGSIFAKRFYNLTDPVKGKFAGEWTPPVKDIQVESAGPNQTTGMTAIFAIELQNQDVPDLFASNVAKNKFGRVFHLDPNQFSLANEPQVAQETTTNQAVIASSRDGGAVGGVAPTNTLVNLKTGKIKQFSGLNNGYYHAGYVTGLAVDSTTGIAATATELNAQVEFYDLAKETATFAQLPCTSDTSQLNSGSGIANDPVNGLFLVTETSYGCGSGSAIAIYDEKANLVETITGFKFAIGEPPPALNPAKRMGWVFGPGFNQLQQFFY
ncbi:MAG TPA: hypothetical protein VFE16_10875 [Candidatus Cybelea sp.]|jgi:hypothetical protein|nr:hypothetical protein [Candidatus Cybelea sp.]